LADEARQVALDLISDAGGSGEFSGHGEPRARAAWPRLQRPRDLDYFVGLQLVSHLDIVEALDRKTAFETGFDFAHVVLEALQRIELSGVENDVVAQDPDHGTALDRALQDVTPGNRADLRNMEHL